MNTRRQFLGSALAASAFASRIGLSQEPSDSRIEVLVNEPIATIAPEIYGHFVENLGGVVYDGIWVGEDSKIPNTAGIRQQLIDAFQKVKPGMVRWPGGCFADQYDWRDGVGPRSKRPKRTNFWLDAPEWPKDTNPTGPQHYDPNLFGTIEFARFCKLTGAQPYFAANLRSLTAQDFWHWVEYCNSPAGTTTLAEQRGTDGSRDPLNVRYWGVGNESWGCGGNFAPEDYASEFKRFSAWVPSYGKPLSLVGSGPNAGEISWTRKFFEKTHGNGMWGFALHHYAWNASAGRTTDWNAGKRDAVVFNAEQYYEILREANRMESLIVSHWDAMGEFDRAHRVKLVVDEWGSWYAPGTEPFADALIGQQNTMRDAVLASLTLDTFHRHADKVAMAAIAQLVNCLQSLFLAHEDKFCVTPTYHVFDMYSKHQGQTAVRTLISSPTADYSRNGKPASVPALLGSASMNGRQLTVTVSNSHFDKAREAEIVIRGAKPGTEIQVIELAANDPHAHNSFTDPDAVKPRRSTASSKGPVLIHSFPPASVTRLDITLA